MLRSSPDPETALRRLRLRVLLKLMALGGVVALALAFSAQFVSLPGGSGPEPRSLDLAEIEAGEVKRLRWNGRHVLVVHRDAALLESLEAVEAEALRDPQARRGRQPEGLALPERSFTPDWLVVYGESADLGCELDLVHPEQADGWPGGFEDRCRGGRYDAAGRVFRDQPGARNLEIPQYRLHGDGERLILGGS
ncbi:ubiquinol-cytochrome c reductase iron-sulfur subunit [Thioalkalivibrio sp. ALE20]|uniref:ubiquinol-cytochrome c reductase iron-sulfur subunit n=1 Tax=Thioalkalivibrio sp. ALE20 TaxID=545275 RepID=UPI0003A7A2EA|nr:ubiquinol-cytochrome c reductase iron-sulfur subunit [Thioalkalivibrio sp. ALE20]